MNTRIVAVFFVALFAAGTASAADTPSPEIAVGCATPTQLSAFVDGGEPGATCGAFRWNALRSIEPMGNLPTVSTPFSRACWGKERSVVVYVTAGSTELLRRLHIDGVVVPERYGVCDTPRTTS